VAAGDDRQRTIAAQGAGRFVLLLIIVADGVQQQLLFFAAGVPGLAGDQLARAQERDRAKYGPGRAVAQRQNKGAWPALATTVVFRKARISRDSLSVATESWLPASTTSWQPVC
jgi:hypothetical protein